MRQLIYGLLLLLISAYVGVQLQHDPGHVYVQINGWMIQSTLVVAVLFFVILFILLHSGLVILHKIVQLPKVWANYREKRRRQQAKTITRQGLIEFSEGYWAEAEKHLIKALPFAETPLLNYLTAARAAQELGDNQQRDDYLREAQQSMPDAIIAVELTQAQLQLAHQQWEQALATLKHVQDIAPEHRYVLKLLSYLYQDLKDWQALLALLPALKKNKVLTPIALNDLEHQVYMQLMADSIRTKTATDWVIKLPKHLKYDPPLMGMYCAFLIEQKDMNTAETILRTCLKKEFNDSLIQLYGTMGEANALTRLQFAESLLKKHANSAALQLCLGQLCAVNQLWGKAKAYLEKSIELKPSCEAYIALADYQLFFNELTKACETYRKAALLNKE